VSSKEPDSSADQVVLVCPSCRGKCRALAAAARKALRCPRCGAAIRPNSGSSQVITIQPARSSSPGQVVRAVLVEEVESVAYTAQGPESTRPLEMPEPDPIEDIEVRRKRPPAPRAPLWSGVYDFPWHACALRAWFLFGIGLSLVALMGAGLSYVINLYNAGNTGSMIFFRVFILFMKGFVLFFFWTGTYAGGFFLATIEDTAGGNPKVDWPDDSIWEKFLTFLYVCWIFLVSAIPFGIAASPLKPALGFTVFAWSLVPSAVLVFPIVLMSALSNNSWGLLWNWEVLRHLLLRPHVLLLLYVMSALLLAPCLALGYLTIADYSHFLFLAPLTGFVWSACLLIYGRLLGRVGWVVTGGHELAQRETRPRRKRGR
jgi:hypothetical protein